MRTHDEPQLTHDPLAPVWMAQPELGRPGPLRAFIWIARIFGRRFTRLLLHPVVAYFIVLSGDAKTASRTYLRKVLGREARLVDIYRHYYAFAAVTLDRVYLLRSEFGRFDVRTFNEGIVR